MVSADMTKIAVVKLNKYLELEKLDSEIKFSRFLHDEIVLIATEEKADLALTLLIRFMEEAAEMILGHNILKAEGQITDCWVK